MYQLVECMVNMLFIATKPVQEGLLRVMKNSPEGDTFLNNLWHEMKHMNMVVRYKNIIDRVWRDSFLRVMLLLKFHQFLIEDLNKQWKDIMLKNIISQDN